jgi:hypothetical protein
MHRRSLRSPPWRGSWRRWRRWRPQVRGQACSYRVVFSARGSQGAPPVLVHVSGRGEECLGLLLCPRRWLWLCAWLRAVVTRDPPRSLLAGVSVVLDGAREDTRRGLLRRAAGAMSEVVAAVDGALGAVGCGSGGSRGDGSGFGGGGRPELLSLTLATRIVQACSTGAHIAAAIGSR